MARRSSNSWGRLMTTDEEARRVLLIETQIDLYRRQARWEPWKALAALVAAAAVFAGGVL